MTWARVSLAGSYGVMMLMLLLHPDHTMDQHWSVHAEIHLRQAIIFAGGFCVMGLVMSWWGLHSRQRWVRWALCLNAACLFGGYGAPPLLLSQEPFSLFDLWGMSGLAAVNVLGLILVFSRHASVAAGHAGGAHGETATFEMLPRNVPVDQPPTA